MPLMAGTKGILRPVIMIARGLVPLVFFLAFALNTMAMSDAMPISAQADETSMMELHAAHKVAEVNYCQQMIQCNGVLAAPELSNPMVSLIRLARLFPAEFGKDRVVSPPYHPPIV